MGSIARLVLVSALLSLLLPVDPAVAKRKSVDDLLKAVRRAHDTGDLLAERRTDQALTAFIDKGKGKSEFRKLVVAVMKELRPDHPGAFVAAPCLAREILIDAVCSGDRTGVPEAAEVLAKFAKKKKRGKAAGAMAAFGQGLLLPPAEAAEPLEEALTACVEERWYETATVVATELAVVHLEWEKPDEAKSALARAAKAHEGYPYRDVLIQWSSAVRKRLPDASEEVLAPHLEALKVLAKMKARAGGNAAGRNSNPTKIGPKWKRWKSKQPIVSVLRTAAGADVRLTCVKGYEKSWPCRPGNYFVQLDGITLAFHGHCVALHWITTGEIGGVDGTSESRTRYRAWYPLAAGETWSLTKGGIVTVLPPKKR